MRLSLLSALSGLVALSSVQPVQSAAPSGTAVAVVQATSASGPGGDRMLAAQKPVFSGDRIVTGASGQAQLIFLDDTKLVVGQNSSVTIDRFVFNPDKTAAGVGIAFTKGALRFITGNGRKQAYTIETPTATLGIRGTRFDIAVNGRIGTGLVVFDGSVEMCSRVNGRCIMVRSGCGAAISSPDGRLETATTAAETRGLIETSFPLIKRQRSFLTPFRVDTGACPRATPVKRASYDRDTREPEKEKPEIKPKKKKKYGYHGKKHKSWKGYKHGYKGKHGKKGKSKKRGR